MKNNTFAFISSPYAAIFKEIKDTDFALELALKVAQYGSKIALDKGYIPFSPVISFNGIYDEKQREEIMKKCYEAIQQSALFISVQTEFSQFSQGMAEEMKLAHSFNIAIECIEYKLIKSNQGGVKCCRSS